MFKSIPLGSPIPLVYNLLGNGFPWVHQLFWFIILNHWVYVIHDQMSHSENNCLNMNITHGQPWSQLAERRIVTTIVSIFKSIPLGSPIPLVSNIKPLGLLVLLVYNMNNLSMSTMIKCHIVTTIVSMFKSIPLGSPIPFGL